MSAELVRRRVRVTGHVQGVFFRATVARAATHADVAGWAANRPDGSVEVLLQGAPEAVDSVTELCHTGPAGARVDAVSVADEAPDLVDPETRGRFQTR